MKNSCSSASDLSQSSYTLKLGVPPGRGGTGDVRVESSFTTDFGGEVDDSSDTFSRLRIFSSVLVKRLFCKLCDTLPFSLSLATFTQNPFRQKLDKIPGGRLEFAGDIVCDSTHILLFYFFRMN